MKKVLEGELISLAHSILQLKNKSDIFQLKEKAQQLYEKLSVLAYAEKHFEGPQPTIGKREFVAFVDKEVGELEPSSLTETSLTKPKDAEEFSEDEANTKAEANSFLPEETQVVLQKETQEEIQEEVEPHKPNQTSQETSLEEEVISSKVPVEEEAKTLKVENASVEEDFGVHFDQLPQFEPVSPSATEETKLQNLKEENLPDQENKSPETSKASPENKNETPEIEVSEQNTKNTTQPVEDDEPFITTPASKQLNKPKENPAASPQKTMDLFSQEKKSLNDQLRKGIKIGLNDRIAFTKHLFENDVADYNRVLSQLNTFATPAEAISFLEEEVKPSYHNWEDKEDIETRFIQAVIARFE